MRLTLDTRNQLVDEMAEMLAGGNLVISSVDGDLVRLPLPAFAPAVAAIAVSGDFQDTVVERTGEANSARLESQDGQTVAELVLRAKDAEDAPQADVVVDRTDFQWGGLIRPQPITLTIPDSVRLS